MTTSIVYPNLTGNQTDFSVPFEYLSKEHVKVTLDGVVTTSFSFLSTSIIRLDTAPTGSMRLFRSTPTDVSLVRWEDGSILLDNDLNLGNLQTLFAVEELAETAFTAGLSGNWDGENLRIQNVADPVEAQDVITKGYMDTTYLSLIQAQVAASLAHANASANSSSTAAGHVVSTQQAISDAQDARDVAIVARDAAAASEVDAQSAANTAATKRNEAQNFRNEAEVFRNEAQTASQGGIGNVGDLTVTPQHTNAVEKTLYYWINRVITPDLFKQSGEAHWDNAFARAIDAAKDGGEPRTIFLEGHDYTVQNSIIYTSGIALEGTERQGCRILPANGSTITDLIRPSDVSGNTAYYRFSMRDLWLQGTSADATGSATNGNLLAGLRTGDFERVHTSNFTNAHKFVGPSYYNRFFSCSDNNSDRGWLCYINTPLASNENSILSSRKNGGVDGVAIFAVAGNINGFLVHDFETEAHSGASVYADGTSDFKIYRLSLNEIRGDSTISGARAVNINDENVIDTTLRNITEDGSGILPLQNNGTNTIFEGFPFTKTAKITHDFGSLGTGFVDVNVPGVVPHTWDAKAFTSSGALSTNVDLAAKVVSANTVRLIARSDGGTIDPSSIEYRIVAKRYF